VHGVLDVAIAVVDVDQDRHVAGRDDVPHRRGDVGEALETDVGNAVAGAGDREAADEHGVEPCPLDQQRAQRVIGARDHEQSPLCNGPVEGLTKAGARMHGMLLKMTRRRCWQSER
jgi:hypothetical protein